MYTGPDVDTLDVFTLADALGLGLAMAERFGGERGEFCALWLGDDVGRMLDFVVCTDEGDRDVETLVPCAVIGASLLGATRVLLWRTDDDLTDGPRLADDYFRHRDLIAEAEIDAGTKAVLVDEIVIGDDELRSMAITTFTDEPGWDDVSDRLTVGE